MNKQVIMIMVDGFGLPPEPLPQSIYARYCSHEFIRLLQHHSVPLNATLGIPGLPQSATEQCALFCGVNAPQIIGRHLPGFPNQHLRQIIREKNIFKSVIANGGTATFANAYVNYRLHELRARGLCSVTSEMADSSLKTVRGRAELLRGEAVIHDITREYLTGSLQRQGLIRKHRHKLQPSLAEITPEQGAADLLKAAENYNFTLFEYFLTDRAGHKRSLPLLEHCLTTLSRFICHLTANLPPATTLLVTADHGNCEDTSSGLHTDNPVPLLLVSGSKQSLPANHISSIVHVHDFIIKQLLN